MSEQNSEERLQAENERLRARVLELEQALGLAQKGAAGFAGYIVRTKNANYNGNTAGVQFRNGVGFIPMVEGADRKARQLRDDFHYQVEQVDDWKQTAEAASLSGRMVEAMGR
jgi:hypothetical protein